MITPPPPTPLDNPVIPRPPLAPTIPPVPTDPPPPPLSPVRANAHPPALLALTYNTSNVGDDIQTLAMLQHAPLGAEIIWHDRDDLVNYAGPPARLVSNGWWAHGDCAWPPPTQVDVLPTSMHVQLKSREHFECAGFPEPVGARDTNTQAWLESLGVESFFSGCMTLAFGRNPQPRSDTVAAVDLRGREYTALRHALGGKRDIMRVTHKIPRTSTREERLTAARERLDLYSKVSLVVTTRLHAALPAMAMGTPVLLVGESIRFTGLDQFVPTARRVTPDAIAEATAFEPCHASVAAELSSAAKEFLAPCSI